MNQNQVRGVIQKIIEAMFEYCKANSIHSLVIGESGGVDSAVCTALAARVRSYAKQRKYEIMVITPILPCESTKKSKKLARKVIKQYNTHGIEINLTGVYKIIAKSWLKSLDKALAKILKKADDAPKKKSWKKAKRVAQGNIKARLRMIVLYHIARMTNGMVIGTGNLSEWWMGFTTLHGDCGDFYPILQLMKGTEVYELAKWLKVPKEIIDAKPDDGLGVTTGGDEAQLGAPYRHIDLMMQGLIQNGLDINGSLSQLTAEMVVMGGFTTELVEMVSGRCLRNAYKRRGPVVLSRIQLGLPEFTASKKK